MTTSMLKAGIMLIGMFCTSHIIYSSFQNEALLFQGSSRFLAKRGALELDENPSGFIILGMHRSGTSMLSGLLVKGFGYNPGNDLMEATGDNEKGYFELMPVVEQNSVFLYDQLLHGNWSRGLLDGWNHSNVDSFNHEIAIQRALNGEIDVTNLRNATKQLNDPNIEPWLMKDPRMCITIRSWLPFLTSKPAVVFTYRNPLSVAMSLQKRDGMHLRNGLQLWLQYNKAAIQNSNDLCRIFSNNDAILKDPFHEVNRISDELHTKCGVPLPPRQITHDIVDDFIDPALQHGKKEVEVKDTPIKVIETYGDCQIHEFGSLLSDDDLHKKFELDIYLKAMRVFCDLQSGAAYDSKYVWPLMNMPKEQESIVSIA
ncbi:hypothetical protein CTEN210_01253 [Chaetoceros tenuissimus]|uniref:Uncharacterized protein n=1 Tax=Chaetoceros tenuissimus TaxID=426638 RepID=A0AAD3GZW9_9STRA|nr:hypothetical protein CTEN210_01253 [Chaetoceros tenuissimus]